MAEAPEDFPEADRNGTLPHPRETRELYGQSAAETAFLNAATSGRLHHAWLITGPRASAKQPLHGASRDTSWRAKAATNFKSQPTIR